MLAVLCVGQVALAQPRGVLSHSARPEHDRTADLLVAAARQKLDAGEAADALSLFEEAFRTAPESYVPDGDVWHSTASLADEAARRAAPAAGARLAEKDREFQRTLDGLAPLGLGAQFLRARDAPWSRPSLGVFHRMARLDFDRGRYESAAAGLRTIAEHPRTDGSQKARAVALEIVALHRAGRDDTAIAARIRSADELLAGADGNPAGSRESLAAWVERQCRIPPPRGPADAVHPPAAPLDQTRMKLAVPALEPAWRHDAVVPDEVATLMHGLADELRGQGIAVVSSARPVVVGSTVVARVLDDVVAFDRDTGTIRWRKPAGSAWSQVTGNLKLLLNDGFADMISRRLVYRTQADALYGRLTSDGTRLFGLREVDAAPASPMSPPRAGQPTADPTANVGAGGFNLLSAYDVESGEEIWTVGGPAATKTGRGRPDNSASTRSPPQPGDWARGVFFLGPPTVSELVLYVIGKVESSRVLFALHAADGELLWRLPLVETSDEPPQGESRPLPAACPPLWHDGTLLCPTASGAVVAVDTLRQRGVWCRRLPRDDVGRAGAAAQNQWNRQLLYPWWDGWREVGLHACDGRVVVTGPDSNSLHVLEISTGRLLWSRPRDGGLFVSASGPHGVVVLGEHNVRCFDLATGEPRWTATPGAIAGRAAHDAATLLVPLAGGGLVAIDWKSGRTRIIAGDGAALGNLVAFPGGAMAQTTERLVRLRPLEERLAAAKRDIPADGAPAPLRTLARLQRDAGDLPAAIATATAARARSDDAETKSLLVDLWLARLDCEPSRAAELWMSIEPLLETPELRVRALERLARSQRRGGQDEAALASWLRLMELGPTGDWNSEAADGANPSDESTGNDRIAPSPTDLVTRLRDAEWPRLARRDRHVQGEIAELLAAAPQDQRLPLHDLMDGSLDAALRSPDPFAVQRFADRAGHLPWGRLVRLRQNAKASIGVGFLPSQLALLDLATNPDPGIAAGALRRHAAALDDRGDRTDAALAWRRLRDEYPDVPLDDGITGRAAVTSAAADALLARRIAEGPPSPWPVESPIADAIAERNRDTEFLPLPVDAAAGSLFERISVSVDRSGRKLRFHGGEQRAAWELALPDTKSMFRTAHPLHRGWAWGSLLVARIGSELFGVAPLNDQGDPKASIVWRVDLYGQRTTRWNQLGVKMAAAAPGFGLDDVVLVDRFARELGRVGPVRAGWLCYRDQSRLVALETATGARLWERRGVPAEAVVAGDAERVLVALPESRRVDILSSLDGRTLRSISSSMPIERALAWHGVRGLFLVDRTLRLVDAADARTLWELPLADGELPFDIDERRCGLAAATGTLRVVDLGDGTVVNQARVAALDRLDRVYSAQDERHCYVALSGPFANPDNQRVQSDRGGFRSPPVSGRLVAIDRDTGRVVWDVPHVDASLPHEQPRETPFLVIHHWRVGPGMNGAENPIALLRLLDKRTGAELHQSTRTTEVGWYAIDPNVDQRRIDLRDTQQTVRLKWE